jgi:hypothetical protein
MPTFLTNIPIYSELELVRQRISVWIYHTRGSSGSDKPLGVGVWTAEATGCCSSASSASVNVDDGNIFFGLLRLLVVC